MNDTPFRPLRRLGHGSMAEVHLADLRTGDGRVVRAAVKRILPALRRDPEVRRRFAEEAEISAALEHRHVVKVYAAEPGGEDPFIAFEHLRGPSVHDVIDRLKGAAAPIEIAMGVAHGTASALAYVHGLADDTGRRIGLVHRDISPRNLLFSDGEVKLIDFGLAKGGRPRRTRTGAVLGQAGYLSPEQARGEIADARSDVFSSALVAYVLATGKHPFAADSEIDQLRLIAKGRVKVPELLGVMLPDAFSRVLVRALSKAPTDRYTGGRDFEEAMHRAVCEVGGVSVAKVRTALGLLGFGGEEESSAEATRPAILDDRTRTASE